MALVLGACGTGHGAGAGAGPPPVAPGPASLPALARGPRAPGEVVVSGQGAPRAHGPYTFSGRYRVRFQQRDPEDRGQSFAGQTALVVYAAPAADQDQGAGTVRLVRAAARRGTALVTLHGRLWINVSFGDFPYAVRLAPLPR